MSLSTSVGHSHFPPCSPLHHIHDFLTPSCLELSLRACLGLIPSVDGACRAGGTVCDRGRPPRLPRSPMGCPQRPRPLLCHPYLFFNPTRLCPYPPLSITPTFLLAPPSTISMIFLPPVAWSCPYTCVLD
jgi:hypothetical protein